MEVIHGVALRYRARRPRTAEATMKISRTVAYAIKATLDLAKCEPDRPIPSSQLAEQGEMPERFLLHVLRELVLHGVLRSTRGIDGGYSLSREAETISLLDILSPFKFKLALTEQHQEDCVEMDGDFIAALERAAEVARIELQKITLVDLLCARVSLSNS
jgi:Rrf2 family protein